MTHSLHICVSCLRCLHGPVKPKRPKRPMIMTHSVIIVNLAAGFRARTRQQGCCLCLEPKRAKVLSLAAGDILPPGPRHPREPWGLNSGESHATMAWVERKQKPPQTPPLFSSPAVTTSRSSQSSAASCPGGFNAYPGCLAAFGYWNIERQSLNQLTSSLTGRT